MVSFKARKRPVVVDVIKYTGRNEREVIEFCGGTAEMVGMDLCIYTLEGVLKCPKGGYVIKGVRGGCYPIAADIFEETYEVI